MKKIMIRHRLLISFCSLIFFFALNLAAYFWGKYQKDHQLNSLNNAIDAQVTSYMLQKKISDLKKQVELVQEMTQSASKDELSPMTEDEVALFSFQIEKVTNKVKHLTDVTPTEKLAYKLNMNYEKLNKSWLKFYSLCGGPDHKKAMITLINDAEPASEKVLMIIDTLISDLENKVELAQREYDKISNMVNQISVGLFIVSLIFAIFISLAVASYISKRLKDLQDGANRLKNGNLEARVNISGNDELAKLGSDFNSMAESLLKARKDLLDSKENISNILNNLSQGFLTFDNEGKIGDDYSKVVETMFSTTPVDQNFDEIIRKFTPYNEVEFNKWKHLAFSGLVDFSSLIDLLPTQFENTQGQQIQLNYRKISDKDGELKKVICIAEDKTQELELQNKALEQEIFAAFILHLNKYPDVFKDFCESFKRNIQTLQSLITKDFSLDVIEAIARYLHTIKGDSSYNQIYALVVETGFAEEINLNLKNFLITNGTIPENEAQKLKSSISSLENIFKNFLYQNSVLIHEKVEQGDLVKRDRKKLESLFKEIKNGNPNAITSLSHYLFHEDASVLFNKYEGLIDDLATKQNKKVRFEINSNGLRIKHKEYLDVSNSFIHLFRNAIDHGIEIPNEREDKGKTPTALISVTFNDLIVEDEKKIIEFIIKDDGRGIDFKKLAQKAIEKGIVQHKSFEEFEKDELQDLIFIAGLSSRNEVTELSGRGVGMDAVKYEIEKLNGIIKVESFEDKGTKFIVRLPLI